MSKRTVIGFLGSTLDAGGKQRWKRWRPTISIALHEELQVDRIVLLYQSKFSRIFQQVKKDIKGIAPHIQVLPYRLDFNDAWDFEEVYEKLHNFARSYRLEADHDHLIHITTGTHVVQICLFLLNESKFLPGRLLQTGRTDDRDDVKGSIQIIDLNLARYDSIATRFAEETNNDLTFLKSGIATRNEKFNRLIEKIEQVAQVNREPMLITGPTGAGKSHLARRVYELKVTRNILSGEFVELNCATLRSDSAMSALFGHSKGAFTGAVSSRKGALKRADGGILFLDEIGELGLDEQAMLLRAIEDKRFLPVGSDSEEESEFELICGTNRNLFEAVRAGTFREDLLSRINLWTFKLPSLAERKEDIEPNLSYELERFARKYNRKTSFNKEAQESFLTFATSPEALWNANFRDLNGAITRMAILSPSGRINKEVVTDELSNLKEQWQGEESCYQLTESLLSAEDVQELDLFDKMQLENVLQICLKSKSMSEAGRRLFAQSRAAKASSNDSDRVRKYLTKFNISWSMIQELQ